MEKLPPYLIDYIITFVPKTKPVKQKEINGLDREIEKLKRSPKLTGMMFYKMDDYTDIHYKGKWKWQL
jgi:hypothetical protein